MFSISSPSVAEGRPNLLASLTFQVKLTPESTSQQRVRVRDAGTGTATAGTDYLVAPTWVLDFPAGDTLKSVTIQVRGDNTFEPDETVVLELFRSSPGATISSTAGTGTGTITNDDLLGVSISPPSVSEGAAGATTTLTFSVNLAQVTTGQVKIAYADAGTGTATSGTDYAAISPDTLTFAAGETLKTVGVTVNGDDLDEPHETVRVTFSGADIQSTTVSGTITDDDPLPTVSISSPSVTEGATGETAALAFQIKLSAASAKQVAVKYTDARTGTATLNVDYAAFSTELARFAPGDTLKTVNVTVNGDALHEPGETVVVTLSQPTNATIGTATGTGTITNDDGAPTVTLVLGQSSVTEGAGGGATWTAVRAHLSAASAAATTVTISAAPGTNATAGDFTLSTNKTLTIAAGDTANTGDEVRVTAVDNDVHGPDKQVTVSGTVSNSIGGLSNPSDVTLTIQEDEVTPKVKLVLSRTTITESGANNSTTVTATMSPTSVQATTITVAATPAGSNADSADFTLSANKTLTIAAGDSTSAGTVTLTAVDNTTDESDKQVTVTGTATNAQGVTNPNAVTVRITDDDAAPTASINSPSVTEGAEGTTTTLTFDVKLSAESGRRIHATVADGRSGTATHSVDYSIFSDVTLTFEPGDTLKTFGVTVRGDDVDEPNETIVVTLRVGTTRYGSGTGTITDDDAPPTVTLSLDQSTINEAGANSTHVRASLSGTSSEATTVTVSAAPGTGADSSDFTLSTNKTLTIAAGRTGSASTVTISAVDNAVDDPDREVTVSGTVSNSLGGYANPGNVTLTIRDDEATPRVMLVLSRTTLTESGTNNSATVTATMTPPSVQATTITVAVSTGSNADSGDFTLSANKTLTIAAGDSTSTGTVTLTAVDNALDERDKSLSVTATATNAQGVTNPRAVAVLITDDDAAPTVSINSPSVAEGATGTQTTLTFEVKLSTESGKRIHATVGDGRSGTATYSADYSIFSDATLTFQPGDTLKTFGVTVRGDNVDEPNETIVVTLRVGTTTYDSGTGTITDDDDPPRVTLSLRQTAIDEGGTGITSTRAEAALSGTASVATTVTVSAAPGTGADSADFTLSANKTLTIAAGQTRSTGTVTISAVDNAVDDPNRQVTVSGTVSNSLGGYSNPGDLTLTIRDDETTPTVTLVLSRTALAESGTNNSATVTATMSPPSVQATTITVAVSAGTDAEAADFTLSANKTLTIAAGDSTSTGTVTLTAVDNALDERQKHLSVTATATNAQGVTNPAAVAVTITDDDGEPSLSISSPSVAEGAAGSTTTLTFEVKLSAESGKQVTVAWADAGSGTATSGTDYAAFAGGTLTFAPGDTLKDVAVTVNGDVIDELNETVEVTLSGATNATISTATGTGTITDDDGQPSLSISSPSVTEGAAGSSATLSFEVKLTPESGKQVTVTWADAASGTATSGTDYAALAGGTLTFSAGETLKTVAVTVNGDDLDEPNETVEVTLSGATNATISTATGTGTITDDDGQPSLSISSPSVTEGAAGSTTTMSFEVKLTPESGRQVTVAWADAGSGTATSGTDYAALAGGTLTFAAGDTLKTVAVTVSGDDLDEPNETVEVTLSGATNAAISTATGTGTITDDDGQPSLSISSPSVTEGAAGSTATLTFEVMLVPESGQQVTVAWGDAGSGTATSGTDYAALAGGTLTFAAGDTLKTVAVTVNGDDLDEPNETVEVALSGATNATISTATGTGTITDDDGQPSLSISSPSVTEGAAGSTTTMSFEVKLSAESGKQVTVTWADAASGTATSGTDYAALVGGTLTFAAGDTLKTVSVTVNGDDLDESNETVEVALSGATNAAISTATGTGTITDDDGQPSLSISSPSVTEGAAGSTAMLTFEVKLSAESGKQVTVGWADAASGTATSGTDYAALAGGTLTFATGDTLRTVAVTVNGDDLDESNETVEVALSGATNATISTATGTGTITDDDGQPSLSISSPSVTEGAAGSTTTMSFDVKLSAESGKQVTVGWADAGSGTATSGSDYAALAGGTLTFATGDTLKTVSVTVNGDDLDEPNETVEVTLSGATNAAISTATGTGMITDDDGQPSLSISSPTVTEGAAGSTTTMSFDVKLSAESGKQVTVTWTDAGSGTATSGTDYAALAGGTLTFAAGDTLKTVSVTVNGDDLDESNETVEVALSGATNAAISTATGTGTITDDDGQPSLSISSPSVTEGAAGSTTTMSFEVKLSVESGRQVTVTWADAASGTATSGTDYAALVGGTLTFAAGDTLKTVAVTVNGDDLDESNETVEVTLSGAMNATISTATGTGTITDDDGQPSLSISSPSVTEGAAGSTSTLTFEVKLSAESGQQVTVTWADAGSGTATSGTDYTALADGTLTFAAGDTLKTVAVTVNGDDLDEPNETVEVTLSNATNATISTATGTGTITDDDGQPSLSISSPSVTEGAAGSTSTLTFEVKLSAESGKQVTVTWADAGSGTAASGTDYAALAGGTLTFATGDTLMTVAVTVNGDDLDESNETVEVALSGATNATISTATGTGTITDDDGQPSLSISSPSVTEGAAGSTTTMSFEVKLTPESGRQVTVTWADAASGTATSGTDYAALAGGTLTFTAGDTLKTVSVTVNGDDLDESNETVEVALSGATNATISTATGTGTITDDDGQPSLSISSPSVTEGATGSTTTMSFEVKLTPESGRQVTVTWADAASGTATSGTDYAALAGGTLTFTAGDTLKTVSVTVNGDDLDESNETVEVALSGATNATISTATGTGTITDDDGQPSLSISSPSVTEGAAGSTATLTFEVKLAPESGQQVTVAWADAGSGTATSGTDYAAVVGGTLTFAAGDTLKTVAVTVNGDDLDEPNETVEVALSGATDATISTATGTGTITDDDGQPSLSISSPSVTEGAAGSTATLTFEVKLTPESGRQVTVAWADAGSGTATSGTDYAAVVGGTLTFAAGDTLKTVAVTVNGDDLDESNETVEVALSGATNATIGTATGTGTITDDDGQPSLSISSPSVTEGAAGSTSTLTFEVKLVPESGQQVTVAWADAGSGTATSGTDYAAITGGTLTFAAGDTLKTIAVTVNGDDLDEPNETVEVALSGATDATISTATGTGTITDDDGQPSLSISSPSVTEGAAGSTATLTFEVKLTPESGQQVTVAWADAGSGTATSGTDYTALAGGTLTFAAGDTLKTIAVTINGDDLDESNETVEITLSGATNATIATATGTGTITDDDDPRPQSELFIDSPSVTEGGTGSTPTMRFTVRLRPASVEQVQVDYADARTGTATPGLDYEPIDGGTLTFAAGETTATVAVTVVGDEDDEGNETVVLALSAPQNAIVRTATGTGTIVDDEDQQPVPTVLIDSPAVRESQDGTGSTLVYRVALSPASEDTVIVGYADSGTGTATPGLDYEPINEGTLVFEPGATLRTVEVSVIDDQEVEPSETVVLALQGSRNASLVSSTGRGVIEDDDVPVLSIDSPRIREGDFGSTTLAFTVALSPPSYQSVEVSYADARTGTAAPGVDYEEVAPGTLTFAPGDTGKTIEVTVLGDLLDEDDETVVLSLADAVNAQIAGAAGGAATGGSPGRGTILDDDGAPTLSINNSPSATEGDPGETTALSFTVVLTGATTKQVTVQYADAGTGTATPGIDYEEIAPGTLTFAPGDSAKTIEATVLGDGVDEHDETVVLSLADPVNAELDDPANAGTASIGRGPAGSGTILDDDAMPTLSINSPSATEGGPGETTVLSFTVALSAPSGRSVTVRYADTGTGTATPGTDYEEVARGTLTFAPGDTARTIEVAVLGDALDEPDETIVLSLTDPGNAQLGEAANAMTATAANAIAANAANALAATADKTAAGTGTILDDDAAPALSINSPSATEGGPGETTVLSFAVALSAPSGRSVTVQYADVGTGTATPGADYEEVAPGTLTFALGDTARTIEVAVLGDALDEPDETVVLSLTDPVNAELASPVNAGTGSVGRAAKGTGTIQDDDAPPIVRADSPNIQEGDNGHSRLVFSVTLDRPSGLPTTVECTDTGTGTATAGEDYVEMPPTTLAFAPGETRKTCEVLVVGDQSHEADETVIIRMTMPLPGGAQEETATGTILNDDIDLRPSFGEAVVPSQRWFEDRPIATLRLPEAQGGNGRLTYVLSPAPPPGLVFDPDARTVAGTPSAPTPKTAYAYTATDEDGDADTLSFVVEVVGAEETSRRLDAVNRAVLPEVARSWASVVSDAVAGRIAQSNQSGVGRARGPGAWAHGDYRRTSGSGLGVASPSSGAGAFPLDWSGESSTAAAGLDVGIGSSFTAGLAASRLDASFDYDVTSDGRPISGVHDTRITGLHPYLGWSGAGGSRVWAVAGFATSDVVVLDEEAGRQSSEASARMMASGASLRLLHGGAGTLEVIADGQSARFHLEGNGDQMNALEVGVHRLRLSLAAARTFTAGSATLTPSVGVGVRYDGGDGLTGTGMEAGGGVALAAWDSRLRLEAAGHAVLNGDGGLREWGAAGALRVAPRTSGHGLSVRLEPAWGLGQGGAGQLWRQEQGGAGASPASSATAHLHAARLNAARLNAEVAYGLPVPLHRFSTEALLTPYAAVGSSQGVDGQGERFRFGARIRTPPSLGIGAGLEAAYPGYNLRFKLELNR